MHGPLGPREFKLQTASRSVQFFFVALTVVTNTQTDTSTDHATPSVAIARIRAMHAMYVKTRIAKIISSTPF